MKLLSSSPSARSNASHSPHRLNSDAAAAAAGCLSGIIRRFVCGTLDVGSSSRSRVADDGTDSGVLGAAEASEKARGLKPPATPPSAPGIVARLMGLDYMPELPSAPQGPIGRSRSTGSLEGWPVLLPVPAHRRSHSFRETPTFLRPENDEFLLLSFSPEDGEEKQTIPEAPQKATNDEMGLRQLHRRDAVEEKAQERQGEMETAAENTPAKKKKKRRKNIKREISREKMIAGHVAPPHKTEAHIQTRSRGTDPAKTVSDRETPEKRRPMKGGNKNRSAIISKIMGELECGSQNSSPVSVLDALQELEGESFTDTSTPLFSDAEEEELRPAESPRRKLSSQLDCFDDPTHFFHLNLLEGKQGSTPTDAGRGGTRVDVVVSFPPSSPQLWAEVQACRLAEGDAQCQPWKTHDREDIVAELGLKMLESLLQEAVYEFCDLRLVAGAGHPLCMTTW